MSILKKTNTGMKNPIEITWPWAHRKFTTYVKQVHVRSSRENTSFRINADEIIGFQNNTITLRVCLDSNLRDYVHYIMSKDFDIRHIRLEGQMRDGDMVIKFDGLHITWFNEKVGFVCLANDRRTHTHIAQEYYEHLIQEIMLVPADKLDVNTK